MISPLSDVTVSATGAVKAKLSVMLSTCTVCTSQDAMHGMHITGCNALTYTSLHLAKFPGFLKIATCEADITYDI